MQLVELQGNPSALDTEVPPLIGSDRIELRDILAFRFKSKSGREDMNIGEPKSLLPLPCWTRETIRATLQICRIGDRHGGSCSQERIRSRGPACKCDAGETTGSIGVNVVKRVTTEK